MSLPLLCLLMFAAPCLLVQSCEGSLPDFFQYVDLYNKPYRNNLTQMRLRYPIYNVNRDVILRHNNNTKRSFVMGVNQWTDLHDDEFEALVLSTQPLPLPLLCRQKPLEPNTKDTIDWRKYNVVSPVQEQAMCGSCWAFAAVSAVESAWAIATGDLFKLSEQALLDCAREEPYHNDGCRGGTPEAAFDYVAGHGLPLASHYPYRAAQRRKCHLHAGKPKVQISDCFSVHPHREDMMAAAILDHGPVTIGAAAKSWRHYRSGIFNGPCHGQLDHSVVIVGLGQEGDEGFWLVKNSWGTDWGEEGYMRIKRGENLCGISLDVSFPVV